MPPIITASTASIHFTGISHERFDIDKSRYNFESNYQRSFMPAVEFESSASTMSSLVSSTAISNPFRIDFTCTADEKLCEMAEKGFADAVARIADVLVLNSEIRVQANFRPFCGDKKDCDLKNTLGQASPSAFLFVPARF